MSQKIRIVCPECDKRLACPPAAAGKSIRCPGCSATLRVPPATAPAKTSEDRDDDPYGSPAGSRLPGRSGRQRQASARRARSGQRTSSDEKPGDRKIKIGASVFAGAIVASSVRMAVMGPMKMSTAEERGRAMGFGVATLLGVLAGLFLLFRGWQANRAHSHRGR